MKLLIQTYFVLLLILFTGCTMPLESDPETNYFTNDAYREQLVANTRKKHKTYDGKVLENHLVKVEENGEIGAFIGLVTGAVIGSKVGKGSGKIVSVIVATANGALIGYELDKDISTKQYVTIKLDDGRVIKQLLPTDHILKKDDSLAVTITNGKYVSHIMKK